MTLSVSTLDSALCEVLEGQLWATHHMVQLLRGARSEELKLPWLGCTEAPGEWTREKEGKKEEEIRVANPAVTLPSLTTSPCDINVSFQQKLPVTRPTDHT